MRVSLQELTRDCGRCGHQNGAHTLDRTRSLPSWSDGVWSRLFDQTWKNATGSCSAPNCGCPARTSGTYRGDGSAAVAPSAVVESAAERLRKQARATVAARPCSHGPGPCGATPTRPYRDGSKCASHAPRTSPPSER